MKIKPTKFALTLACAALLALAGCGGSDSPPDTDTPPTESALNFSGTAAAGLPLVGNVTVKDANGATRSTAIGTNGLYAIDVTGMTPPFVFRAEGTVGGRTYVIHSAASAAETNGTINITPLTDLIVANIAGQVANVYFNSGNFSGLNAAGLKAETDSLKAKLLPVLMAMGVEASIDLLRTPFTPLSSALDKALDVISVSVDPDSNVATITNLITQQQITDSLVTQAAAEASTDPLSGSGMQSAADDIALIRKAVTDFSDKFQTGLPLPADLLPLLHTSQPNELPFRHSDQNATQFTNEMAGVTELVGGSFADVVIRRIDYDITSSNPSPRAFVEFVVKNSTGQAIYYFKNMQIAKGADAVWRLRGDGRVLDVEGYAHNVKNGINGCLSTGLEFNVQDPSVGNSSTVSYVVITGPGLPTAGLEYERNPLNDYWGIRNVPNQMGQRWYVQASTCFEGQGAAGLSDTQIASIPEDAVYTIKAYDEAGAPFIRGGTPVEFRERILSRPMTLAEAAAAPFPTVTSSSPLSTYAGGDLTISATNLASNLPVWMYLGLTDQNGFTTSVDDDALPNMAGTASLTLNLNPVANVNVREVRVESVDTKWRTHMTAFYISSVSP